MESDGKTPLARRRPAPETALDLAAIFMGLLGVSACLLVRQFRLNALGAISPAYLVPAAWLAVFSWRLAGGFEAEAAARNAGWRLRVWALAALGLAPFVWWWSQTADNLYLTAMAALAAPAAAVFLYHLLGVLRLLARAWDAPGLERRARMDQTLVIYFVAAPVVAIWAAGVVAWLAFPETEVLELYKAWHLLPLFLKVAMVLPILDTAFLTWNVAARAAFVPVSPESLEGAADVPNS